MTRMAREEGEWYNGRPLLSKVPRVMGQTLGLFAFGNVARCTARRAKAFGMRQETGRNHYATQWPSATAAAQSVASCSIIS